MTPVRQGDCKHNLFCAVTRRGCPPQPSGPSREQVFMFMCLHPSWFEVAQPRRHPNVVLSDCSRHKLDLPGYWSWKFGVLEHRQKIGELQTFRATKCWLMSINKTMEKMRRMAKNWSIPLCRLFYHSETPK